MGYWLSISTSESKNEAANQSTVSATLYLNSDGYSNYSGYSFGGTLTIGSSTISFTAPSSYLYPSNPQTGSAVLASHSVTYTHDANGNRGAVGTSGVLNGPGGYAPGTLSTSGTTYSAINYDRKPGQAGTVTAVVNADKTISVSVGNTTSLASSPTFYFAYSTNNGSTWSTGETGTTTLVSGTTYTGAKTFTGLTPGQTYLFRAYATNSDGTGATRSMTTGVFLMSGGKRWNGTAWTPATTFKRWNGTAWVDITIAKRWDGSAWVNLQ